MHPSVNGGSRRADSRSDVEVNIPHGTLGDHQTRNALSVLYGSNWTERELQMPRVYRDSATPGGFPYQGNGGSGGSASSGNSGNVNGGSVVTNGWGWGPVITGPCELQYRETKI